jgi:hypothetical protein
MVDIVGDQHQGVFFPSFWNLQLIVRRNLIGHVHSVEHLALVQILPLCGQVTWAVNSLPSPSTRSGQQVYLPVLQQVPEQ